MESEKKNINIWKTLQKVPAGTMFVPLIIGALITTLTEGVFHFDLWATLGNPMKDMFSSSGQMLLIGLMLFCTSLRLGDLKDALHRGVLLILVRLGVAYALSALFFLAFGYDGVFGISFLAFVCAVTSANAALYMGIIQPFGDKADKASFGVMLHAAAAVAVPGLLRHIGLRYGAGEPDHFSADPVCAWHASGEYGYGYPQGVCRRKRDHPAVSGL